MGSSQRGACLVRRQRRLFNSPLPSPWNLVPGLELGFETTAHTVVSKHINTASTPDPQTLNPKQLRCALLDDSVPQFRAKRQPTSISDLLSAYIWLEFLSLAMNTCQMSMRGAPSAGACASFHWRMRRAFGGESGERGRESGIVGFPAAWKVQQERRRRSRG